MIYFKSEAHKERFISAMQEHIYDADLGTGASQFLDQEYAAAFYVLCADNQLWERAQSYIESGIRFEELLQQVDLSGGYQVLVRWAANLFNGSGYINPIELMRLDESNFKIAMAAVSLRRSPATLASISEVPLSDQALYLTLQSGRACLIVQEEYAAGNISSMESYNRLYEIARTVDVKAKNILSQLEKGE